MMKSWRDAGMTPMLFSLEQSHSLPSSLQESVAIPLVDKKHHLLRADFNLFIVAKEFAAGVILGTGFVHILRDAQEALTDPCPPKFPWSKLPFPGVIAMMAALAALLAHIVSTQVYERKHEKQSQGVQADTLDTESESRIVPVERQWSGMGEHLEKRKAVQFTL